MDDTIYRQDAIRKYCSDHCGCTPEECGYTLEEDGAEECSVVRFLKSLPSAQPNPDEWCLDCKEYDKEKHSCPRWNQVIRNTVEDMKAEAQPDITKDYAKAALAWFVDYQVKCASLNGRYTPYEVLGWVVNDWRRENGI